MDESGGQHRERKRLWATAFPGWLRTIARHVRQGLLVAPHGRISFAQEGEDLLLERLVGNRNDGFYVDVGAHHPTRFSNTYLLYKRGWRGINIDAAPGSMRAFRRHRPRDINLELAIGEPGSRTFYVFDDSALNTMSRSLSAERRENTYYKIVGEQQLSVRPLHDVLAQYLPADVERIDLMTVDVEGLDFEVIRSNDWSRFRPEMLLIEILGSDLEQVLSSPEIEFLSDLGYEPYSKLVNSVLLLDPGARKNT